MAHMIASSVPSSKDSRRSESVRPAKLNTRSAVALAAEARNRRPSLIYEEIPRGQDEIRCQAGSLIPCAAVSSNRHHKRANETVAAVLALLRMTSSRITSISLGGIYK